MTEDNVLTECERVPRLLCGGGCRLLEGEEECREKETSSLISVPEESCDLAPAQTCRETVPAST